MIMAGNNINKIGTFLLKPNLNQMDGFLFKKHEKILMNIAGQVIVLHHLN